MAASEKGVRRIRITVPEADVSTIEWLDAQDNVSVSVRTIIHEYIEREGFTDPHNRPVRQIAGDDE